jgi:hypothetical protein
MIVRCLFICFFSVFITNVINFGSAFHVPSDISIASKTLPCSSDTYIASLDCASIPDTSFKEIEVSSPFVSKFKLSSVITAKILNQFFWQYSEELKSRKALYPGFRLGKYPPSVGRQIKIEVLQQGIGSIIDKLCRVNKIDICEPISTPIHEDNTRTVQKDSKTNKYEVPMLSNVELFSTVHNVSFEDYCNNWMEGNDFSFVSYFYGTRIDKETPLKQRASLGTPILTEDLKYNQKATMNNMQSRDWSEDNTARAQSKYRNFMSKIRIRRGGARGR